VRFFSTNAGAHRKAKIVQQTEIPNRMAKVGWSFERPERR